MLYYTMSARVDGQQIVPNQPMGAVNAIPIDVCMHAQAETISFTYANFICSFECCMSNLLRLDISGTRITFDLLRGMFPKLHTLTMRNMRYLPQTDSDSEWHRMFVYGDHQHNANVRMMFPVLQQLNIQKNTKTLVVFEMHDVTLCADDGVVVW